MYKKLMWFLAAIAFCLGACQPAPIRQAETSTPAPTSVLMATDHPAIEPYQDVRNLDLTRTGTELTASFIQTLSFNQSTRWPPEAAGLAEEILTRGMNPGLGLRGLHAQGITGQGVTVAIIDQNMVLDHPEYKGKIVQYFDTGTNQPASQSSMHGPAVTSLLVGENIGSAPGAGVVYAAAPSWTGDAQFYADALDWIVAENEKLPEGAKIRVVSVSAAPSGPGTPFSQNNEAWDAALERAAAADLLVLDCSSNRGITAPCSYDLNDPDDPAKCAPGWPDREIPVFPDKIYIPTSYRTTAEVYAQGSNFYQYSGIGGCSWSIPYLSGVLALGWQLQPDMTGADLLELVFNSAYVTPEGLKIINPPAFIEMVKKAGGG